MRMMSDNIARPDRVIVPVLEEFPANPIIGEIVYFNQEPHQGLMLFTGQGWVELFATDNNVWETIIAEPKQLIFELQRDYPSNGKSINVFVDGRRLSHHDFVEISPEMIAYQEMDEDGEDGDIVKLKGGEVFEFQLFNLRKTKSFDIKSFNRRNGIC
jgi:hypothetical protein